MPSLHVEFSGVGKTANGQTVPLPPVVALTQMGPVIAVTISVSETISQQLVQQGKAVPQPRSGNALIDTGASITCIDDNAAQAMGLPVVDRINLTSASHQSTPCNVYPVLIEMHGVQIRINAERAVGVNLAPQGILALIGRDILQRFTLFYNGFMGQITLSF